jgi:hypothetical protein
VRGGTGAKKAEESLSRQRYKFGSGGAAQVVGAASFEGATTCLNSKFRPTRHSTRAAKQHIES